MTSHIEDSSEEVWTDDVLCDMVVKVTSTCCYDGVLHMAVDEVWHDLRLWSGQSKDDRLGSHAFHVIDSQGSSTAQADDNVSACNSILECSLVCFMCEGCLVFCDIVSAFIYHTS